MELQSARQIIDTLAQGIHPVTGEAMPVDKADSKPATKHTNVWDEVDEQPTNIQDAADPTSVAQQAFLKRQGYA